MEDTHDATCAHDQERALRTFDDIVGWFTHEGGVDHVPAAPAGAKAARAANVELPDVRPYPCEGW
ncbi:hypothetical protein [Actinocrispum wychmicini]|uniref:Uncharacterized protein n=1 Tax=Actinocrispum wychmicini TaxID=1213861 RepID=A0A4R2JRL1_9PSEU|nr:hypothetical protein [Actinocrispum wychmicini]TCO59489.1 hypothetical protein EV192_104331 [Actinocrispum wychmicini]